VRLPSRYNRAMDSMGRALTIAGSDSGGGAGIQADLKTFTALGVYGMSALTAVTAQNTVGVQAVHLLPPELVAQQIDSVCSDIGVDAAKTGMLGDAAIVAAVAEAVRRHRIPHLVVDPVMMSKGGEPLLLPEARAAVRRLLLPLAEVITPNLPEAGALLDLPGPPADPREAARRLHALGPRWVVVKGGHGEGPEAVDVVYDGHGFLELRRPRLHTRHTHGTGCTFSAAIAAHLARGADVPAALAAARDFVQWAIAHAPGLGAGHGPTNHLYFLREDA
jgi:hydroxymethylpyrimidine/phosphomethylpyrimidine kinase